MQAISQWENLALSVRRGCVLIGLMSLVFFFSFSFPSALTWRLLTNDCAHDSLDRIGGSATYSVHSRTFKFSGIFCSTLLWKSYCSRHFLGGIKWWKLFYKWKRYICMLMLHWSFGVFTKQCKENPRGFEVILSYRWEIVAWCEIQDSFLLNLAFVCNVTILYACTVLIVL